MKLAHRHLGVPSKKQLFIIGGGLLVISLVGYILWSRQAWNDYQAHYTQWRQTISAEVKKAALLPASTPKERLKVVSALEGVAQHIEATNRGICEVHPLIQWQVAVIASVKLKRSTCQTAIKQVADVQSPLGELVAYAKADATLADILTTASQSEVLTDVDFDKQRAAWDKAAVAIDKLIVPKSLTSVQQQAGKQAGAAKEAWQAVIAAHQAKDKKRYLAAQDHLAVVLDGLDEVSRSSQKAFMEISIKLRAASAAAFDK